jgi:hypothetical protein
MLSALYLYHPQDILSKRNREITRGVVIPEGHAGEK